MRKLRSRFGGRSLYLISQMTRRTCRYQVNGLPHLEEAQASGRPIIFATWHGNTMMLVGFFSAHYDFSRIVLLMPDDWRGAMLSHFSQLLGAQPFPMNLSGDSSMATARKLAKLVRQVRKGADCYITPDGPDGPGFVIKPGAIFIAQKAKALILPVGAYLRNGYHVNRWDMYTVPYPFSRISIEIGPPISVDSKSEEIETAIQELTNQLHRVSAQAAANYYELVI